MSASHLLYIGNKLAQSGKTATTIDTLTVWLRQEGYDVRTASAQTNKFFRLVDMCWQTMINRKWADYVLIDTYSTANFWYAITVGFLCTLTNMRYIPLLHGGNLPNRLKSHPRWFSFFLNNAHAVVSPSDYLKHAFAKSGYHNILVIPNTLTLEQYPHKLRSTIEPRLLWVRSFADIYNPNMALNVLEMLRDTYPHAQLLMVGPDKDGTLIDCKKRAVDLDLNIEFTGLLVKSNWIARSSEADVFINTSRFDNMPVSVLEAMALGLPVVSTNVGGMKFMIEQGENGLLVDDNSPAQMVDAIVKLLHDPLQTGQLSQTGRDFVRKMDWEHIKHHWKAILQA